MNHRKHLYKLLQGIIAAKLESDLQQELYWHHLTNWIPEPEDIFRKAGIVYTGSEKKNARTSFAELRKDSKTEYLQDRELNQELSKLMIEVIENRALYLNQNVMNKRIQKFLRELLKSLSEYEIVFKIHNMNVDIEEVKFWDFKIVKMSDERLLDWGLDGNALHVVDRDDFKDQNAIILYDLGNNLGKVEERCRERAIKRLRILQTYLKEQYSQLRDFQLQLHLSEEYLIRKVGEKAPSGWRLSRPIAFDYKDLLVKSSEIANADYLLIKTLTPSLQEILERSLNWMGLSIREPNNDVKIAFLCTALEAMLTTKSDARKGERLAYRAYLISMEANDPEGGLSPHKILHLYNLRSIVVHGSNTDIGSHQHYWTLYNITKTTFESFLKIAYDRRLPKQSRIFSELLRSQYVAGLLDWLGSFNDEASRAIAESLRAELLSTGIT